MHSTLAADNGNVTSRAGRALLRVKVKWLAHMVKILGILTPGCAANTVMVANPLIFRRPHFLNID